MTAPRKRNGVEVALIEQIAASRRVAEAVCRKKTRYADEHACRAAGIREMELFAAHQLYFYQCAHCRGCHLTHLAQPPYFAVDYLEKRGYK